MAVNCVSGCGGGCLCVVVVYWCVVRCRNGFALGGSLSVDCRPLGNVVVNQWVVGGGAWWWTRGWWWWWSVGLGEAEMGLGRRKLLRAILED